MLPDATGPPALADDLLYGAAAIAEFLFGSAEDRRRVYWLAESGQLPTLISAPRSVHGAARFNAPSNCSNGMLSIRNEKRAPAWAPVLLISSACLERELHLGVAKMLDVRSDADQAGQDPHLDIGYSAQPIDPIRAGREAWDRLSNHKVLHDWFVFREKHYGRTEALIEARTNKPSGRRYNEAIGAWLRSTGFIDIHKSIRSRTVGVPIEDHRQDVEEFLATLKLEKRIKLNNPTVILSAWKRSLTKQEAKEKIKLGLSAAWNKAKAEERRQFLGAFN